jgi:uncharacterized membrane protein
MPTWAILVIGGVIPAICWGVTAIFQKQSAAAGFHPMQFLALFGAVLTIVGIVGTLLVRDVSWPRAGVVHALLAGATFSIAATFLSYALWRYGAPISRIAPILSGNVLVTVAIGALFLGEGAELNVPVLGLGTLLIVGGVILVSNA